MNSLGRIPGKKMFLHHLQKKKKKNLAAKTWRVLVALSANSNWHSVRCEVRLVNNLFQWSEMVGAQLRSTPSASPPVRTQPQLLKPTACSLWRPLAIKVTAGEVTSNFERWGPQRRTGDGGVSQGERIYEQMTISISFRSWNTGKLWCTCSSVCPQQRFKPSHSPLEHPKHTHRTKNIIGNGPPSVS